MNQAELEALPEVDGLDLPFIDLTATVSATDTIACFIDSAGSVWEVGEYKGRPAKMLRHKGSEPKVIHPPVHWSIPDMDRLCFFLNNMPVGRSVEIDGFTLGQMSYNWLMYSDHWQAMRGKLMGSSYGSFRRRLRSDGWTITKHDCGEPVYDRDGYPLRQGLDPTTDYI